MAGRITGDFRTGFASPSMDDPRSAQQMAASIHDRVSRAYASLNWELDRSMRSGGLGFSADLIRAETELNAALAVQKNLEVQMGRFLRAAADVIKDPVRLSSLQNVATALLAGNSAVDRFSSAVDRFSADATRTSSNAPFQTSSYGPSSQRQATRPPLSSAPYQGSSYGMPPALLHKSI
jgi:hypothetical protein